MNKHKGMTNKHMSGLNGSRRFVFFGGVNAESGNELGELFKTVFVSPDGASVDENIPDTPWNPFTFKEKVQAGGDWDYKKNGNGQFENFGNFNFGATGIGNPFFLEYHLINEAGRNQSVREPEWGEPNESYFGRFWPWNSCDTPSCGDDPVDTDVIMKGVYYYKNIYASPVSEYRNEYP